jgi:hypothetical protein
MLNQAHWYMACILALWYVHPCNGQQYAGPDDLTAWGLTMAAYHTSISVQRYAVELAVAFLVAFIMRSFACTVNDICDYEFDKGVGQFTGIMFPIFSRTHIVF